MELDAGVFFYAMNFLLSLITTLHFVVPISKFGLMEEPTVWESCHESLGVGICLKRDQALTLKVLEMMVLNLSN